MKDNVETRILTAGSILSLLSSLLQSSLVAEDNGRLIVYSYWLQVCA